MGPVGVVQEGPRGTAGRGIVSELFAIAVDPAAGDLPEYEVECEGKRKGGGRRRPTSALA